MEYTTITGIAIFWLSFLFILIIWWNMQLQVSIFFDIIFIFQHYVIYPHKKAQVSSKLVEEERTEPLVKSPDHPESENV